MKRVVVVCVAVLSCAPPFQEPALLDRDLGGQGDPPKRVAPQYVPDAGEFVFPDAGCCAVRFAYPAGNELAAELFGFTSPFRPSVPLVRDAGVWEALVCMPRATIQYGYRLFVQSDVADPDAGLFELVSFNPNAPTLRSREYGLLNEFQGADAGSCAELSTTQYGDTTVLDAGTVSVPFDAGSEEPDGG